MALDRGANLRMAGQPRPEVGQQRIHPRLLNRLLQAGDKEIR
jgi:hypothetical protein